jgi:hypothetical protein
LQDLSSFASQTGNLGLFLGFLIILVCAFAFNFNEIAGIVLVNVGVIFVNFMGLIKFGNIFVTAMVAISVLIIAVMER